MNIYDLMNTQLMAYLNCGNKTRQKYTTREASTKPFSQCLYETRFSIHDMHNGRIVVFCFIQLLFLFLLPRLMSFKLNLKEQHSQYYIWNFKRKYNKKRTQTTNWNLSINFYDKNPNLVESSVWVWVCEVLEFIRCTN